jgi:Major Facilitator Superfamily
MPTIQNVFATRIIVALGVTQIIGYGTLYYTFGVIAPALAADLSISLTFAFGAFSAALLAGALAAPIAGRWVDRVGARIVMMWGSVLAALTLAALSLVPSATGLVAVLVVVELVSVLVLYDAAFAALAQALGAAQARRAITLMTLIGGFASTVFWPATQWLMADHGWRMTVLIYAALHVAVCLPLHASLPRWVAEKGPVATVPSRFAPVAADRQGEALLWLGMGFALAGVVLSGITTQLVSLLQTVGMTETAAVAAGALMGPAQVAARVVELGVGGRLHPVVTAMIACVMLAASLVLLAVLPVSFAAAALFAVVFGMASGLTSIVRGTAPLALFGSAGFGARLGWLARVRLVMAAVAPVALTFAVAVWDVRAALLIAAGLAAVSVVALGRVPR